MDANLVSLFSNTQIHDREIYELWNSRKTMLEMLADRKYDVKEKNMDLETFKTQSENYENLNAMRADMHLIFPARKNDLCELNVIWNEDHSVSTTMVKKLYSQLKTAPEKAVHCILIIRGNITPYAAGALTSLKPQKFTMEIFTEQELQYNISQHVLVPRHIICSAEKKKQVLQWFGIEPHQLQKIKVDDQMCKYLGAKRGQLIKIVRPSETMTSDKLDVSYRLVV